MRALKIIPFLFAGGLSACGGELPLGELGAQFGGGEAPQVQKNEDGENVEMILHPVAVWDEQKTTPSQPVNIDGREVFVRFRKNDFLERPFVRVGLFWHSRKEKVFVPIVVLGPPVKIRAVEVRAGGNFALLRRAENFNFTPAQSKWDGEISSAAFEMKPSMLRAIADEKTAYMRIKTNRGDLHLGLDVAGGGEAEVRGNARYLFMQFADQMAEVKKQWQTH